MDRRGYESPMDFEWQNQGPGDPTSPFYQLSQKGGQRKGFQSPIKTQQIPATPSIFSTASKNKAPEFRNPSFTTPRKPFDPELFSEASGAESSPADNADAEDTPETIKAMVNLSAAGAKKPIFGRYGLNFTGNSPGRGELRRGKYADTIVNKVRKRKRLERDYAVVSHRRGSWDSEGEDGDSSPHSREKGHNSNKPGTEPGWFSSLISGIESRPSLPYVLSYYAQLVLNWFMVFLVIYLIWCFFLAIRADVDKASEEAMTEVLAEMAQCTKQYVENGCSSDKRPPALETICESWELCMNKDPRSVGRAKISAHTFAQIFNSFVEPISWKAMSFVVIILTVCLAVNNVAFGAFRSRGHPPPAPQYFQPSAPSQDYQWGPIPQTPRHISAQGMGQSHDFGMYGGVGNTLMSPQHDRMQMQGQIMPSQTPQRSPRKASWQ